MTPLDVVMAALFVVGIVGLVLYMAVYVPRQQPYVPDDDENTPGAEPPG